MIVFAYLREGGVYRDHEAWENGDRLGTYIVVHASEGRHVETDTIGGKRYTGLWIWEASEDNEEAKEYGIVPLLSEKE